MACEMLLILNLRKTNREWTQKPKQTASGSAFAKPTARRDYEVGRTEEKNKDEPQMDADKIGCDHSLCAAFCHSFLHRDLSICCK
jgi:hypothetical protein